MPNPSTAANLDEPSDLQSEMKQIREDSEASLECQKTLADFIRTKSAGMYLAGSNQGTPLKCLAPAVFQAYFDELYREVGCPAVKDPLHQMLVEQLVLAHHTIGRLIIGTSNAKDAELLRAQGSLAIQLMAEFRRTVQAVASYSPKTQPTDKPAAASIHTPISTNARARKKVA